MGQENARLFWDGNGTVIERTDGRQSPLVSYPFTKELYEYTKALADIPPDRMSLNKKLRKMHNFVDPNKWRRLNRALIPEPFKWKFMSTDKKTLNPDYLLWKMHDFIASITYGESASIDYDTYIAPYVFKQGAVESLRNSSERGYKNSMISAMPWSLRWDLDAAVSYIRPYLDPRYSFLLNPDIDHISGGHLKPSGWVLCDGGATGMQEVPVVIDDDNYLLRLAEHLGFIAFSTVNEIDAKQQQYNGGLKPDFPFKRNGNGEVVYDCPMPEIAERVAKMLGGVYGR